jgi:repressor LexA
VSGYRNDQLTVMQQRILHCIREAIVERGEAPNVREIGAQVGMRSAGSVHYQLQRLEEKGAIVRQPGRWRGIKLSR